MQEYNSDWTLKQKLIFILQELGRAHTPYQLLEIIVKHEQITKITTSAILLCSKSHPDYLHRYHDVGDDYVVVGLREWFSESGIIKPEFAHIYTPKKVKPRAKYGSSRLINQAQFLPMSFRKDDLGPLTFTKKTLDANLEYDAEWVTSNKILYLLNQNPTLSGDQLAEAIIEQEPYQKRRLRIIKQNVEICIKRLLHDKKVTQLTDNVYYLTLK